MTRRPKDRKEQIVVRAHALFVDRGFPRVSMAAIADEVGITAAALYRHFRNKTDLLQAVLDDTFAFFDEPIPNSRLDDFIDFGIAGVEESPTVGILWNREIRYLPEEVQAQYRARFRAWSLRLLPLLRSLRPELQRDQHELLIWSFTSVLASLFSLTGAAPEEIRHSVARKAMSTLVDVPLLDTVHRTHEEPLVPQSRRESLLQAAIDNFGRQGYSESSLSSIGSAAGVSAQNVYSYFASKADLLQAVIDRGIHASWFVFDRIIGTSENAETALHRLVDAQLTFSPIWTRWAVEPEYGEEKLALLRASQREYANEWVALLIQAQPGLDPRVARVRVGIATALLSDLSQMPNSSRDSAFAPNIAAIARTVLCDRVEAPTLQSRE